MDGQRLIAHWISSFGLRFLNQYFFEKVFLEDVLESAFPCPIWNRDLIRLHI
ncbi:unnamed protein product [Acidithrix sp. C25]|nr:unnamed protein product [Acidithrix sp. C25]